MDSIREDWCSYVETRRLYSLQLLSREEHAEKIGVKHRGTQRTTVDRLDDYVARAGIGLHASVHTARFQIDGASL